VFDEAERQTPPRDELIAAVETEKPAEPSAALAGAVPVRFQALHAG